MSVLRIAPLAIVTPSARVRGAGPVSDTHVHEDPDGNRRAFEDVTIPSETVVLVALTAEQAGDIIDNDRHASWICNLTDRLNDLVDDGAFSIERDWEVSGTATVTVTVSGIVTETNVDDARSQFAEQVRQDIDSYTQWDDADVDDVSIDHTERS